MVLLSIFTRQVAVVTIHLCLGIMAATSFYIFGLKFIFTMFLHATSKGCMILEMLKDYLFRC